MDYVSQRNRADGKVKMKFRSPIRTTGVPKGFTELSREYMIYMLIRDGKVVFISAGKNFAAAEKFYSKYQADRIVYMPCMIDAAEEVVAALVAHYQPPYNFKSQSIQLAELDAILSEAEN